MGTTLTGTTPQDTYDSLIKVTDNGPLSGTLKALSDGLGNDSTLSLSTTAASIAGTLAVTGNATFDTNTLFVNASTDRVGVGTTAPNTTLSVVTSGVENTISPIVTAQTSTVTYGGLYAVRDGAGDQRGLVLQTYEANVGLVEKVRITSAGRVGIADAAPLTKLSVGGSGESAALAGAITFTDGNSGASRNWTIANGISASGISQIGALTFSRSTALNGNPLTAGVEIARFSENGLSFNGDTAAANALDDYEEGTWTMGVSFGGASVGVTYDINTGTYTKIGRQVTVNGLLVLTSKGSSTGNAKVTGLPFTIANNNANYSTVSLRLSNITFTNQFQGFGLINSTTIDLEEVTILGAVTTLSNSDFADSCGVMISFTYFV